MSKRYYAPDGSDTYVTPSRFKQLGEAEQEEYMAIWFRGQFCDPAEETPYNGREGGYLYVHGGPFDAADELWGEFEGLASEQAILNAIVEVESDGISDWAPSSEHPNQIIARDEALEEWLFEEGTKDPYSVFIETYDQTRKLLADHGDDVGRHLLNRMIFAQQVAALEAYLGDTLINGVQQNEEALKHLLADEREIKEQKFTLAQVSENPSLVTDTVATYLRKIIYHNLPKVDFLYKSAFGVKILDDQTDKKILLQAIKYRHDCVHRDGRDIEGKRLKVFSKTYVQKIADTMRKLVDRIELEVWGEPPF